MNDQELAALKGAADGDRFGRVLVVLQAYGKAFIEASRAAIASLEDALAQARQPAVINAECPNGPGEGDASQTPDAATGHTEGARDATGGQG